VRVQFEEIRNTASTITMPMCKKYRGYFEAPFLDDFDMLMFLLLRK
jgi:hypothetical protein